LVDGENEDYTEFHRSEGTGRPLGTEDFIKGLERILGRKIVRRSLGRKPVKDRSDSRQMSLLE